MHKPKILNRWPSGRFLRSQAGIVLAIMTIVAGLLTIEANVQAANSVPRRMIYNGRLLGTNGTAITTPHRVRFTFWIGADAVPTDLTGTGSIRPGAPNYVGWTEEQTFTPDSKGSFYLQMGSVVPLPSFANLPPQTLSNLFLQVEVKPDGGPDSQYEILDPNPSSPTVDRSPILSVPFALNADRLDQRDLGTGSGSIPLLLSGGLLPISTVPGGTFRDAFVIDANDNAPADTALIFGRTLGKMLKYDKANGRFDFNDDVNINGNLTVNGLINGVDVTSLSGSGGIATKTISMHPSYPDVAFSGDGTDNVGQLALLNDAVSGRNSYQWKTTRATQQDYTITVRRTVPQWFQAWVSQSVRLSYKTSSNDPAVSSVSIAVFDSAGAPVTLAGGPTQDLTSNVWTASTWDISTGTWNDGDPYTIKITVAAGANADVAVGELRLRLRSQ
jgi:hypothetical protein